MESAVFNDLQGGFMRCLYYICALAANLFLSAVVMAQTSSFITERIVPDWEKQEMAQGRTIDSPEALAALAERAEKLLALGESKQFVDSEDAKQLRTEIAKAQQKADSAPSSRREVYIALRTQLRNVIFKNPLIRDIPIVFLQEDRYIWQLIHEYNSYYYRFSHAQGGDMYQLDRPGQSFDVQPLIQNRLPRGILATPTLSYDAKTLYFAFADFSKVVSENAPVLTAQEMSQAIKAVTPEQLSEYQSESEGKYHLFSLDLATNKISQLTDGPFDDIDPCLLPDGDLIFISTRRGGYARCTDDWEPVQTATLHKRRQNGEIVCLSWHETNEWNPSVLQDGRILYTRWDYVDREAARYMNLWITNPDGTNAQALFGNYTEKIVASLQAKEIPNSRKILFLGSGHHIAVGGTLAILDPTKTKYDPETLEDTLDCIEPITPDIAFPETPSSDPSRFHVSPRYYYGPYPLSEDFYLTSYSHDSNGGYLASNRGYGIHGQAYKGSVTRSDGRAGKLGIYYQDRYGNLELIYEDEKVSCRYPIQIKARRTPNVIPSRLQETPNEWGSFVLSNVYESLAGLPKDRPVVELRVFELLPKFPCPRRNVPKIGLAHAENPRNFLGTVPVEKDGSAYFRAPACKPLYFQAVDADGRAVQTMLSEVYLMPGEQRGCIGCHEQIQTTQKNIQGQTLALKRPASELKPGPDGSSPFSYPRLVQPILNRACVRCHGEKGEKPNLTDQPSERFFVSYENLAPYLKYYDWSSATIRCISSKPGLTGSVVSPLVQLLNDENHKDKIILSDQDRRTLYLWLDANVPFYGTGDAEEQVKQKTGAVITVPEVNK